jgi:Signal transduction histidine kinase
VRLDQQQNGFEFLSEKNGYPLGRVNTISFDNENSLWVSTGRNGLVQLKETSIVNMTTTEGLNTNKINIIVEDDKTIYIGSDAGGVDMVTDNKIKKLPIKTSLADAGIRDIYIENESSLWISSYRGVLNINDGKERLYTMTDGLPANDVRRILPDDQGNLWFGTRSGGIAKFQNGKVTEILNKENALGSNYILSMEKDSRGNIYIGTHSGGLSIRKPDGTISTHHIQKDDAGMLIFNIHIDEHSHVWLVTNIGPYFFDGTKFKKIELNNVAKGETYFDWIEDNLGAVWITTNIGVLKIKKNDIENFIADKVTSVDTRLFDNQDGMKSKECTGATRSLLSSAGKLWVPTIGGISIFYPEKTKENKLLPPVYITTLLADNTDVALTANVSIPPGKLRYTFNFTAPSFIAPRKIQFRYKLEPVDGDWIPSGVNRQAEYTNLAPGDYTYKVMTSNSDGIWNEKNASLSFTVKPFFYQTYWFYLACVIAISTILYLIYRWRINEVERRNEELRKVNGELDRFVYSASHDLRAPLASILGLVNIARLDKHGNIDDYLEKIERSVNKLDGFVKDIIDFARNARTSLIVEPIHFDLLINEVMDDLKYLDDKNQIRRNVKVTSTGSFATDRKRLTIILSNLISNAIKYFNPYAKEPFIEVLVDQSHERAIITIRDNGIGIAQEHVENIFKMFYRGDAASRGSGLGLYIVKETLEKINGKIEVKSTYGEGSIFTLTLPSLQVSAPGADKVIEDRADNRKKDYSNYP